MTKIFIRAIIGLNFLCALVISKLVFGHASGSVEVALAWLVSSIWVAAAAAWSLKCAKRRGWVGILLALGTVPVGVVLAYTVILLRTYSGR